MVSSWSYSKYALYNQCPLKFKFIAIDRMKEPKSDALKRGIETHSIIDKYINGRLNTLPENLKYFKLEFERLRKFFSKKTQFSMSEQGWAYTANWQPCAYDDYSNAWVRAKLDCVYSIDNPNEVIIVDWKTGKFNPQYNLQKYIILLKILIKFIIKNMIYSNNILIEFCCIFQVVVQLIQKY